MNLHINGHMIGSLDISTDFKTYRQTDPEKKTKKNKQTVAEKWMFEVEEAGTSPDSAPSFSPASPSSSSSSPCPSRFSCVSRSAMIDF